MRNCLIVLVLATSCLAFKSPPCRDGRSAIVHLFEWTWNDIQQECERFLGPQGFCGVQVSPPNEHKIVTNPFYPWWQRYQPVSYKLQSRSGDDGAFRRMVEACNNVGVYIFVDAVIQHMSADSGTGSGGSRFDSGTLSYEGVPYSQYDFNCCHCGKCSTGSCNIENYGDANQVRNCRLVGLPDLDVGKDYVRGKIADYMNYLIGIGVAGFRIDAVKHMWPGDVLNVVNRLNNLNTQWFPSGHRPFIYQEVIDLGNEPIKNEHYLNSGRVTEFKYGMQLGRVVRRHNQMRWLRNFGEGWGMLGSNDALIFVDNHDNQRGHGAGGRDILSFYFARQYKIANAFMLAFPYGFPRIMSSYRWNGGPYSNDWIGPPSYSDGRTKPVPLNSDGTCGDGWVCEHRWRQIFNMVQFRNVAGFATMTNWWDNQYNQIAFARQGRAFIAINNQDDDMNVRLQTSLPGGRYCDVISGHKENGQCTGSYVDVGNDGNANIYVNGRSEDPVVAIHIESRL